MAKLEKKRQNRAKMLTFKINFQLAVLTNRWVGDILESLGIWATMISEKSPFPWVRLRVANPRIGVSNRVCKII